MYRFKLRRCVKAIVLATGLLKNANGEAYMGYKVRFTFTAGRADVKAVVTLCNTYRDSPSLKTFNSFEARLGTSVAGGRAAFGESAGSVGGQVGTAAHLFQGFSDYKWRDSGADSTYWLPPMATKDGSSIAADPARAGYEISIDGKSVRQLGDPTAHAPGWIELQAAARGISVSFPWIGAYWPASFDIGADGLVTVGLYSRHSTVGGYRFPFFAQDARELHFDFHAGGFDNVAFNHAAHYPVVAKAPWEQYASSACLFGETTFVTPAQQSAFFADRGYKFNAVSSTSNPTFDNITRCWSWGAGGGHNQGDYVWGGSVLDWLRTGYGGNYLRMRDRATYLINLGTLRTDWDYVEADVTASNSRDRVVVYNALSNPPHTVEMEHHQLAAAMHWYFLTGDEEAAAFIEDDSEVNLRDNLRGIWPTGTTSLAVENPATTVYLRAWCRKLRNMAYQWEWSLMMGRPRNQLKVYLDNAMAAMVDAESNAPQYPRRGRSFTRGYYTGARQIHSFFTTQIQYEALYQAYRVIKTYDPENVRIADMEEMLGGMSQFIFKEYYHDEARAGRHWDYNYYVNTAWIPPGKEMVAYPADRPAVFGYQYDGGDESYLLRGAKAFAAYQYSAIGSGAARARTYKYNWFAENQAQTLMHAAQVRPPSPVLAPLELQVTPDGGNVYSLSWIAPANCKGYRIKFSDKPIVNHLGYNKLDQSWRHDPATHTARFAATLYDAEVKPSAPGARQALRIDVPAAIKAHNELRGRQPDQIGYVAYEPANRYYFDLRYWRY